MPSLPVWKNSARSNSATTQKSVASENGQDQPSVSAVDTRMQRARTEIGEFQFAGVLGPEGLALLESRMRRRPLRVLDCSQEIKRIRATS